MNWKRFKITGILLAACTILTAQPSPGDLYREYTWFNDVEDCGGTLRVGGRLDYRLAGNAVPKDSQGRIVPDFDLDLGHATRAELVVEKMLCHGGTEGLRVSINGHDPVEVPESPHVRRPQSAYAHHFNAVFPIDLAQLNPGRDNRFEFEVDTAGHWWPQNLVYGMILRIYHVPSVVTNRSRITHPAPGDKIGMKTTIKLDVPDQQQVGSVDLVGFYEDADLEGDGRYTQWHYAYHQGKIYHHVASMESPVEQTTWDTEWLPDQPDSMKLAAFVHLKNGYTYMTEAVEGLVLERPSYSVELCKPYRRPKGWFTRNGEFEERFRVKGEPSKISEARMVFRSWSPGYLNGIYINDFLVFIKEGPRYDYFEHEIPVETHVFERGENILKTGKTPLYHGEMVHGTEVQWPGIMLKIKYDLHKTTDPFH